MPHEPSRRLVLRWLADCLFLPLAIVYSLSAAAFGCSGSVSVGGGASDPNRALGTYAVPGSIAESDSTVFFGYWLDGDSGIDPADGQAFQGAVGVVQSRATIAVVPNSILYEETATEVATGNSITVSISGTWRYDSQTRMRVDWGSAIVTSSTFPPLSRFALARVGTRIQEPQFGDLIFSSDSWSHLTNALPGPLNGVFLRVN